MGAARHLSFASILKAGAGPIARGSVLSLAIKLTGMGLTFVQAVLAARLLGAGGYGTFAIIMSVVQLCSVLALLGYGDFAIRHIPRLLSTSDAPALRTFLFRAVITTAGAGLILALLAAGIAGNWTEFSDVSSNVILLLALLIIGFSGLRLCRLLAQGFGSVGLAQWPSEILRPALTIVALLAMLFVGAAITLTGFLTLYLAASIIGLLIAVAGIVTLASRAEFRQPEATIAHSGFSDVLPFFWLSLLAVLYSEFATLMLGLLSSAEQAGLFQPIARLVPLMALTTGAVAMRYAPRLAEFWSNGEIDRITDVTAKFTLTTTLLTGAITLTICLAGPWILWVFGPEFVDAAPLLWIAGAGQVFSAACGPVIQLLSASGQARAAMISRITGLVVALVVAAVMIPASGALGATIAITCGFAAWNIPALLFVRKYCGFDPSIFGSLARIRNDRA